MIKKARSNAEGSEDQKINLWTLTLLDGFFLKWENALDDTFTVDENFHFASFINRAKLNRRTLSKWLRKNSKELGFEASKTDFKEMVDSFLCLLRHHLDTIGNFVLIGRHQIERAEYERFIFDEVKIHNICSSAPKCAKITFEQDKKEMDIRRIIFDFVEEMMARIRLFKKGRVGFRTVLTGFQEKQEGKIHWGSSTLPHYISWDFEGCDDFYTLNKEEAEEFRDFYNLTKEFPLLKIPAYWNFYRSYHQPYLSLRFLDLCLALEALLGDGGDNLKYKIAMRGAYIAGLIKENENSNFGAQAFDFLKKVYDERSKLAHGGKSDIWDYKADFKMRINTKLSTGEKDKYKERVLKEQELVKTTTEYLRSFLKEGLLRQDFLEKILSPKRDDKSPFVTYIDKKITLLFTEGNKPESEPGKGSK
jgi:hypothetical protein